MPVNLDEARGEAERARTFGESLDPPHPRPAGTTDRFTRTPIDFFATHQEGIGFAAIELGIKGQGKENEDHFGYAKLTGTEGLNTQELAEILTEATQEMTTEIASMGEAAKLIGSTFVASIVHKGQVLTINAGDSRAIKTSADGTHSSLSQDHSLDNPAELERVLVARQAVYLINNDSPDSQCASLITREGTPEHPTYKRSPYKYNRYNGKFYRIEEDSEKPGTLPKTLPLNKVISTADSTAGLWYGNSSTSAYSVSYIYFPDTGTIQFTRSIGDTQYKTTGAVTSEASLSLADAPEGSQIVLCSDGITDYLSNRAIAACVSAATAAGENPAQRLIQTACANANVQSTDNKSCVVIAANDAAETPICAFVADGHGGPGVSAAIETLFQQKLSAAIERRLYRRPEFRFQLSSRVLADSRCAINPPPALSTAAAEGGAAGAAPLPQAAPLHLAATATTGTGTYGTLSGTNPTRTNPSAQSGLRGLKIAGIIFFIAFILLAIVATGLLIAVTQGLALHPIFMLAPAIYEIILIAAGAAAVGSLALVGIISACQASRRAHSSSRDDAGDALLGASAGGQSRFSPGGASLAVRAAPVTDDSSSSQEARAAAASDDEMRAGLRPGEIRRPLEPRT